MINSQTVSLLMRKFLLLFSFFLGVQMLHATEEKGKLEVTAKALETSNETVKATDGVVVYYQDSIITAESASYSRKTKMLVLDGSVEMIGYRGTKEHTTHLEIDTERKEVTFEELFFVTQNDVWLFTQKAHRCENNYSFETSLLSSCDVDDPLWRMAFSSSLYDSEARYMKVYGAKVYFGDLPIFYTPYLAFSTHKERSSGLLFPLFGYTAEEGYLYEQPLFWAMSESMDLELNPQIRTDRSKGLYGTFRFVDSDHSSGKLRVGYFRDSEAYQEREETNELEHYGLEFNYKSSRVFSQAFPAGFKDGLYINSTYLNDIDYINLQKRQLRHFGLSPLQESRLNYFLSGSDYYAGVNAKYFVDTRKKDNNSTLQILPSVQLHKHLDRLIWNNLTYSVDLQLKNFDREEGVTMKQAEIKLPLEFSISFFDDYLNISLGEELYYSKFFFGNDTYEYDRFEYYSNIHKAKLFTDLTKDYDSFIHVLQPSIAYIQPGHEHEDPTTFDKLSSEQRELFAVGLPEEYFTFSLGHYFYDNLARLKFYQRISQKYYPDRENERSDINNEMQYNVGKWQFYNELVYSHAFGDILESSSRISLRKPAYNFTLGHTFKQNLYEDKEDEVTANDMSFDFGLTLNKRLNFTGGLRYNIKEASKTQWSAGWGYKRDCWSMNLSLRQDIIPRPEGSTLENTIYLQLNFIPFGGVESEGTKW